MSNTLQKPALFVIVDNMPITKSAKKAIRQNKKRNKQNTTRKRNIKDRVKQAKDLVGAGKTEEAKKLLPQIYKALDKAAKAGTIKKNTASRKKSRMTKLINKVKQETKK